eukprot:SAG31_NODE_2538_length_5543_cov_13.884093_5_plen_87_part_00
MQNPMRQSMLNPAAVVESKHEEDDHQPHHGSRSPPKKQHDDTIPWPLWIVLVIGIVFFVLGTIVSYLEKPREATSEELSGSTSVGR